MMDSNEALRLIPPEGDSKSDASPGNKPPAEDSSPVKDKLWIVTGYLATMATVLAVVVSWNCVQALGTTVPGFQLNVFRFVVNEIIVLLILKVKGLDVRVPRGSIAYLLIVGLAYCGAAFSYYEAPKYLPVGIFACLNPTGTIIMTATASAVLTRKCQLHTILAIALCVAGSVLYAQPEFIFRGNTGDNVMHPLCGECSDHPLPVSQNCSEEVDFGLDVLSNSSCNDNNVTLSTPLDPPDFCIITTRPNIIIGYVYCIGQSVCITVVLMIANRKLDEVHPVVVSFWNTLIILLISPAAMLLLETPALPSGFLCWTLMLVHCFTAGVIPLLQFVAVRLIDPVIYMLMSTCNIVLFCISQYTVMQDVSHGNRNALAIIGATSVLLGNAFAPLYRMYEDMREKTADEKQKSVPSPSKVQ